MPPSRGIRVSDGSRTIVIPAAALDWQFVRSSGPGGQHVNRTSSKAVLRFSPAACPLLPADVRQRLVERERPRLTQDGVLVIASQRHREQPRNVADCLAKLSAIVARALVAPTPRRRTKQPRSAARQRLQAKKQRSETKRLRARPDDHAG